MGEKETVSDWAVCLLRHLQILTASFLEHFSLDHIAKLKCDHFYSGLPKWLKAMVTYLKAHSNERMYSNYLWVVREDEKEEVMSFFPSQKLKGNQPGKIPTVQVVHLQQDSADKEERAKSDDPNGI